MGYPAYIYTNLITGSITITPSTEDAVYTKASLYDQRINKPFRFTSHSGTVLFSFAAPVSIDLCVILKHNFTAAATIELKYGTTNAVADGTETITWAATNCYKRFSSTSKQYWRLDITNAALGATCAEMCEVYLGVAVPFSGYLSYGWEKGVIYTNDIHQTEFLTVTAYERNQVRSRRYTFSPATSTVEGEVETLYSTCSGNYAPFVLIPDLSTNFCMFGRLAGNYGAMASPPPYYSASIDFREEPPGKAVT